jgi:uncharacterized damage-inducible protein DinB
MSELAAENVEVLEQLIDLVDGMSASRYRQHFGSRNQHTIGKHVRHIIDHYEGLVQPMYARTPTPVNYEHRRREASLETVPEIACDRLREICGILREISAPAQQHALDVDHSTTRSTLRLTSSVGRELAFLSSHTIHHMAIIGLLAEQMGVEPAREFGVHPSTLRHWERQERRAAAI